MRLSLSSNGYMSNLDPFKALGQCTKFISEKLPGVTTVRTSSTAAAAKALLEAEEDSAAIASSVCATVFPGLEVLYRGIQNEQSKSSRRAVSPETDLTKGNFTRFFVISRDRNTSLPSVDHPPQPSKALMVLHCPPTQDVSRYLGLLKLFVSRIDRRPALTEEPFFNLYFLEVVWSDTLVKHPGDWESAVDQSIHRVRAEGGNVELKGLW